MALQSLPPEAHREPSGETVTVFRYPVWPMWLILRRQLVKFQTYRIKFELFLHKFLVWGSTYLNHPVPTARNDDGVLVVRGEANAGNPIGVSLFLDGVLALSKGVPQLDGLVPASRDDLTVINRESHAEDILYYILIISKILKKYQMPWWSGVLCSVIPISAQVAITKFHAWNFKSFRTLRRKA